MRVCPVCQHSYSDATDFCPRDGSRLAPAVTPTEAELATGLARRYRIIRRLGAGGMGTVFLAEQIAVGNRPVALKVLLRKLLDDPEFLMRFHNEAASTGRIHHPNVVTIYESGQAEDGAPYIAMEYLEGESLRQVLQRRGALPVSETVELIQQVARGLNAAHRLGIIHRDLKPDNIFVTGSDEAELLVKVVDFGIAKLRESATHTLTGTVLGTPAYMSYEQASGMRSEELDARSDVYSLGVVVYEMLTGRVPFHSDTPLGFVRKHMMEEPPPFRAVAPGLPVPPAVEAVVMKALTKDRNQRYPSALEFARELTSAAQVLPRAEAPMTLSSEIVTPGETPSEPHLPEPRPSATHPPPVSPKPAAAKPKGIQPAPKPTRARLGILALILMILSGAVGYWWWQRAPRGLVRTLAGHTSRVSSVAFSPDGRTLASGSWDDKTIKLWEVATGREVRTLAGHTNRVSSVAFSPDGRTLASGSGSPDDKTIKLWEVATGRELSTLTGHTLPVLSVAFSPDGRTLASGSYQTIKLWDVATGRELSTLAGHTKTVWCVAFSPDGRTLASGSDESIKLWEVATGTEVRTLAGYTASVTSVAFSPDGRTLASGNWDKTIKLWEVATGREVRTLAGHTDGVASVAFSPDGRTLASGSRDKTIKLWEVATGRLVRTLAGHTASVTIVAFSPDGSTLASGSYDGSINLWRWQK